MSNFFKNFILCSFLGVTSATALADETYAVSGSAYSLKTGKLVYRELFSKMDENSEVHVTYTKPDGTVFARKVLNYSTEVFQPGVVFSDDRDDETVSAIFDAGRLLLTHKVKGDSQTKTLYDTLKLVIDAGADAFIQQNWNKLIAGKKVEYVLADPRHLGTERLVIKEIDVSATPLAYKGAAPTWKYFRVDTANKLSSVFVEPIYYAYEPEGKFLMRYQGRANIDSDSGEFWEVRLEYEYW
ncbi:MAG: hypothetical protein EOO07_26870 [Chitinophagaceae bacterium]|nr:MAG: hypothetical protein EOO07_26870 [Chitinophagaceae bacterium]